MNKIIEAAREAGFEVHPSKQQARVGWDALTGDDSTPKLARFYAIARAEALEDAAKVCDRGAEMMLHGYKREGAARCAESIRALKEQQHG